MAASARSIELIIAPHLVQVALGFGQIGRERVGVILRVVGGQHRLAAGKQCIVDGQRDLGQGRACIFGVLQLAVCLVQVGLQAGDLLFQLGDLLVQLGDGVPQLGRHVGLLAVQLGLACVQLGLGGVQFLHAIVDFFLVGIQLFFGIGQAVTDLDQQFVVDSVDLFLVERDLHRLFHQARRGHAGHAVHALELGQHVFADIVGQLVNIHAVVVHGNVLRRHHVRADLHQRRRGRHVGQRVTELVYGGAGLDHGAVHVGVVLVFQKEQAVVLIALARHVLDAVQRRKCIFQRLGHIGLNLLGAGAGVGRDDHQVGQVHGGQQVRSGCRSG